MKVTAIGQYDSIENQFTPTAWKITGALIPENYYNDFISFLDVLPKSQETYKRNLEKFADYFYENRITRPNREDILRYREYLKAKGLKNTTISGYLQAVKMFFKWLNSEGLYPNVADHVKAPKISREHKKGYLSSLQAREMLENIETDNLEGRRNYAICTLMITCGLRCVEVARANIEDFRTLGNNVVLHVRGKGRDDKAEYVIVPEQADKAIRSYLEVRGETDTSKPLFVTNSKNYKGERISEHTISKICKTAMKNIGLNRRDLTAHSFRHTAVTLSIIGGEDIRQVSQFARHRDISTTEIYIHENDMSKNKCSNIVASQIFAS